MEGLKREGKSPKTLKTYETSFNSFSHYVTENSVAVVDESVCPGIHLLKNWAKIQQFCMCYIEFQGGLPNAAIVTFAVLLGKWAISQQSTKPSFICSESFVTEYEAFCEELVYRGHRKATIESNTQKAQLLITYLMEQGVASSEDITIQHVENYLKHLKGTLSNISAPFCMFSGISFHFCMSEAISIRT